MGICEPRGDFFLNLLVPLRRTGFLAKRLAGLWADRPVWAQFRRAPTPTATDGART
jgi:hypothetical protein